MAEASGRSVADALAKAGEAQLRVAEAAKQAARPPEPPPPATKSNAGSK